MYTVYKITDLRTDEIIYIGKTNNFDWRKRDHFRKDKQSVDKYMLDEGRDNFEMTKLQDDIDTNDEAVKIEDNYIVELKPMMNKLRSGHIKIDNPNEYYRVYAKSEKQKEYMKEYHKQYRQSEKYIEYHQSDNYKARRCEYMLEYKKSDKYREYQRQWYLKKKQDNSLEMTPLFQK